MSSSSGVSSELTQSNPTLPLTPTPAPSQPPMAAEGEAKLFVGNLPIAMTEHAMLNIFSIYGPIHEVVLLKPNSIGVRGGFVRFVDKFAAENAIVGLNGQLISGSPAPLMVRMAETEKRADRHSNSSGLARANGHNSRRSPLSTSSLGSPLPSPQARDVKLFVGNVPADATERTLEELFEKIGQPVEGVVLLPVNSSGVRGALVRIPSRLAADVAISSLHGTLLPDSRLPLQVRLADQEKSSLRSSLTLSPEHQQLLLQFPPSASSASSIELQLQQLQELQQQLLELQHQEQQQQQSQDLDSLSLPFSPSSSSLSPSPLMDTHSHLYPPSRPSLTPATSSSTNTKLFVGNLPAEFAKPKVMDLFQICGEVRDVALLPVNSNGVAAAIVRFDSPESAQAAIATYDKHLFPESIKPLQVRFAEARKPAAVMTSPHSDGIILTPQTNGHATAAMASSSQSPVDGEVLPPAFSGGVQLYVGNLPQNCTEEMLTMLFSPFGVLVGTSALFVSTRHHGSRGAGRDMTSPPQPGKYGFVRFADPLAAQTAIGAMDGVTLDGISNLVVRVADPSKGPKAAVLPSHRPPASASAMSPLLASESGVVSGLSQLQLLSAQVGTLIKNLSAKQKLLLQQQQQ